VLSAEDSDESRCFYYLQLPFLQGSLYINLIW
jgi:hypothetical protein